jgi:hypothetical protein
LIAFFVTTGVATKPILSPQPPVSDMAGRYGDVEYTVLTKRGFLLGVALFAIGALGELGLTATGIAVPDWERALLFDLELLGILIGLLSPFVFGVVLPLTE